MDLHTKLLENRSTILRHWFESVVNTYPKDTAQFLRRQKNAFSNPVGSGVKDGMEGIIDSVIDCLAGLGPESGGLDREKIAPLLDRIVRIRAVQSFSASDSIYFATELGPIFLHVVGNLLGESEREHLDELMKELLFMAFDNYVECRHKIWEIKTNDEKRALHMLLRRAKILNETEPAAPELPDLREDGLNDNHQ